MLTSGRRLIYVALLLAGAGCGSSSDVDAGIGANACLNQPRMACVALSDAGCTLFDVECCGGKQVCAGGGELMAFDAIPPDAGDCMSTNFSVPCP